MPIANRYDDLLEEEREATQIALKRLSAKEQYERIYRIRRSTQLSYQHKILPRDPWTKPEEVRSFPTHAHALHALHGTTSPRGRARAVARASSGAWAPRAALRASRRVRGGRSAFLCLRSEAPAAAAQLGLGQSMDYSLVRAGCEHEYGKQKWVDF